MGEAGILASFSGMLCECVSSCKFMPMRLVLFVNSHFFLLAIIASSCNVAGAWFARDWGTLL